MVVAERERGLVEGAIHAERERSADILVRQPGRGCVGGRASKRRKQRTGISALHEPMRTHNQLHGELSCVGLRTEGHLV